MSDIYGTLGIDPSIAPQPTPGLLTYLRGIGLDIATVQENKDRRLATIASNKIRQDQMIAESKVKADENQVASASSRGVSRSGENDKKLAEITNATTKAYGDSALGAAQQTDDAERQAQAESMGLTRQATEFLLSTNEQQQRDKARTDAQMEAERARLAAETEQGNAYLALLREQYATGTQPYVNPYELAQQGINKETYASLASAPPEGNLNLGTYAQPAKPKITDNYTPVALSRSKTKAV